MQEDLESQMLRLLLERFENRRASFRKPVSFTEGSYDCLSSYYAPCYVIILYTIFFGLNSSLNKEQQQKPNVKKPYEVFSRKLVSPLLFLFCKKADFLLKKQFYMVCNTDHGKKIEHKD